MATNIDIINELKKAYGMELETVENYLANSIDLDGVLLLQDVKRRAKPLTRNGSASLWDIGDGVLCLEFHTKMNAVDPELLGMISKALALTEKSHKALVIHNEADNFSVGHNDDVLAAFTAAESDDALPENLVLQLTRYGRQTARNTRDDPLGCCQNLSIFHTGVANLNVSQVVRH